MILLPYGPHCVGKKDYLTLCIDFPKVYRIKCHGYLSSLTNHILHIVRKGFRWEIQSFRKIIHLSLLLLNWARKIPKNLHDLAGAALLLRFQYCETVRVHFRKGYKGSSSAIFNSAKKGFS